MNGIGLNGYSLKLIDCQHHDLVQRVQRLRQRFEESVDPRKLAEAFVQLRTDLSQLRDQMDAHFLLEATGGYLEDAVSRLPRLSPEATALEHQHSQLLLEVERLTEMAAESMISPPAWRQIAERYEAFATRMLEHEAAETRILQEGFNEDASLFD